MMSGHMYRNCTHNFNIEQMRNYERLVAFGEFVSNGASQDTIGEEFNHNRGIQKQSPSVPQFPYYVGRSRPGWDWPDLPRAL